MEGERPSSSVGQTVKLTGEPAPRAAKSASISPPFPPAAETWARTVVLSRSEEHTSELQSLMRISYAVFCLKKKIQQNQNTPSHDNTDHIQLRHETQNTQ